MELFDIFMEIAAIENALAYGQIEVSFDKLACAMKPGHPADILDEIIIDVGDTLMMDPEAKIPPEKLSVVLKELKEFSEAYGVQELEEPIRELEEYLA